MHELASTLRPELVKYLSQNHNQCKSKPIYTTHSSTCQNVASTRQVSEGAYQGANSRITQGIQWNQQPCETGSPIAQSSDGKEAAATSKDSDTDLPDEPEESEDEEAKLPSRREDPEDDTAATGKGAPRALFKEILGRGAAVLSGTSTKKRKSVTSAKPARKSKKASTRTSSGVRNPTEDVPANEPQAPNEGAEANAVTPTGHA